MKPRRLGRGGEAPRPEETNIVKVTCGFCKGKGKDPHGLMSKLSNCSVCGGRGAVWIREPYKECNFCKGSGKQPKSPNLVNCGACKGKGVVPAIEPSTTCPTCGGSGMVMAPLEQYCLTCKGQGVVRAREGAAA